MLQYELFDLYMDAATEVVEGFASICETLASAREEIVVRAIAIAEGILKKGGQGSLCGMYELNTILRQLLNAEHYDAILEECADTLANVVLCGMGICPQLPEVNFDLSEKPEEPPASVTGRTGRRIANYEKVVYGCFSGLPDSEFTAERYQQCMEQVPKTINELNMRRTSVRNRASDPDCDIWNDRYDQKIAEAREWIREHESRK